MSLTERQRIIKEAEEFAKKVRFPTHKIESGYLYTLCHKSKEEMAFFAVRHYGENGLELNYFSNGNIEVKLIEFQISYLLQIYFPCSEAAKVLITKDILKNFSKPSK